MRKGKIVNYTKKEKEALLKLMLVYLSEVGSISVGFCWAMKTALVELNVNINLNPHLDSYKDEFKHVPLLRKVAIEYGMNLEKVSWAPNTAEGKTLRVAVLEETLKRMKEMKKC